MQYRVASIFLIVCSALPGVLCAQERGQYILGSNGLNSGIQPAASFSYLNMPGLYSASRLKAPDGSPINTSGTRPGQTFNFEGGLGQKFPLGKTLFQIGAVGFGQWQTIAANGRVLPAIRDARYSVAAVGPQASLLAPKWNLNFVFRYEPEFAASSHIEGTTMMFDRFLFPSRSDGHDSRPHNLPMLSS